MAGSERQSERSSALRSIDQKKREKMEQAKDKVLIEFSVLWAGWECDSTAWVMERADGSRYLKMTSHGNEYEAKPGELAERIAEYEKVLTKSREALALLTPSAEGQPPAEPRKSRGACCASGSEGKEIEQMTVEQIAEVCHETNRAYCATLGDNSQPPWATAPEWQRTIVVNGVRFHLNNPDAKPSHSHDEWLKEKQATGWKFGPVKDADKKEHPCFVPYEELLAEQKAKDALFIGVVHALRGLLT